MGRTANSILGLAATLVLASCASPPPAPVSMRDPSADFTKYHSFGWAPATAPDNRDAPLQLLDKNIRAAIANELKRRGYVEAIANPDINIAYETASADKIESNPVRVGVGVGSWGGNVGGSIGVGSPSVRNFREGTLVIHAIDRAQNAEVWQGRISGRMTQGSVEAAAVQSAVSAAMRDFPSRVQAVSPPKN
jgi:hypothetical protein